MDALDNMAEPKTKPTNQKAEDFLNTIEPEEKRKDSFEVLHMMKEVTGLEPVMWGPSIIGFGLYHFKSEKSAQEGDWPLIGFSPRKQNLTLYIMFGNGENQDLFSKLGKHKTSKACVYINRLSDVDVDVLKELTMRSYQSAKQELI